MKEKQVLRETSAKITETIIMETNRRRTNMLKETQMHICDDLEGAQQTIEATRKSIHVLINSRRGGLKGVHGYIGERAQVGISNALSKAKGEKPVYVLIDDNGPVDYMKGNLRVQQKACRAGGKLGLDHIEKHNKKYSFAQQGNTLYEIPKDFHEKYDYLRNLPATEAGKLRREEYRLWKNIQKFEADNEGIKVESMHMNYDEIQSNTIDTTLDKYKEENKKIWRERFQAAERKYAATFKEGAKVTACAAATEGVAGGAATVLEKIASGKDIWGFDKNDWKDVGKNTVRGTAKGAIRGGAVYLASNVAGIPVPIASGVMTVAFEAGEEVKRCKRGEISKEECFEKVTKCIRRTGVNIACGFLGAKLFSKLLGSSTTKYAGVGYLVGSGVAILINSALD